MAFTYEIFNEDSFDSAILASPLTISATCIGGVDVNRDRTVGFISEDLIQMKVLLGPPIAEQVNVTLVPLSTIMKSGSILTLLLADTRIEKEERERQTWR